MWAEPTVLACIIVNVADFNSTATNSRMATRLTHAQIVVFLCHIETKGGALSYERVKRHLRNTLRQKSAPVVTTLFDLYRLDTGFPGFQTSLAQPDLQRRLEVLRQALHADIVAQAGCIPGRFIPFIQPYEFEALLFSDIPTLVSVEPAWGAASVALATARNAVASPEYINDGHLTKPAARLERELSNPRYHKRRHGPIVAQKIGLPRIEAECAFFAGWLTQLRSLAAT